MKLFFTLLGFSFVAFAMEQPSISDQSTLDQEILENFRGIVADYYDRKNLAWEYSRNNDQSSLNKILTNGFWYPNDYFDLLDANKDRNAGIKKRLDFFIKHNNFYYGYVHKNSGLSRVNKKIFVYKLSDGADIIKTIDNINDNLIFIDCAMALELAYYKTIIKYIGPDKCERLFDKDLPLLANSSEPTMLNSFLFYFPMDELSIGKKYYISNHSLYKLKEVNGDGLGFNLIVSGRDDNGENLFIGFGLNPQGVRTDDINRILVEEFNKVPYNHRIVDQDLWGVIKPKGFWLDIFCFLSEERIDSVNDQEIFKKIKNTFLPYMLSKYRIPLSQLERNYEELLKSVTTHPPMEMIHLSFEKLKRFKD